MGRRFSFGTWLGRACNEVSAELLSAHNSQHLSKMTSFNRRDWDCLVNPCGISSWLVVFSVKFLIGLNSCITRVILGVYTMAREKHPGASDLEILNEPDWTQTHTHHIGIRSRDARFIGLTHAGDEWLHEIEEDAEKKQRELREKLKKRELVTVRDVMTKQKVPRVNYMLFKVEQCLRMSTRANSRG